MAADPTVNSEAPTRYSRSGAEMTILEHLKELRNRVFVSAIAIVLGIVICFWFWEDIFAQLIEPARQQEGFEDFRPAQIGVAENLFTAIKISLYGGFILASPVVIYQAMAFIMPALTARERRVMFAGVIPLIGFMAGGMAFAYWIVLPASLGFLLGFGDDISVPVIGVQQYTDFVIRLVFWIGVSFELPVVMGLAAKLGMVRAGQLWAFKRYAIVIVVIIAAIVTPTPDAITLAYVAVPLLALYFLGIVFALLVQPRRNEAAA